MNNCFIVEERFCGPSNSGNGGYVCGMLAGYIDGVAEVMLRMPPPLERELYVECIEDMVLLKDGESVVAEARATSLDLVVPEPPTFQQAEVAAGRYSGFKKHAFPRCFVCGPERSMGDGMRIFPGPVEGRNIVASPWIPHESFADEDGYVKPEFLWAAMDCPGAFAVIEEIPVVLGKLTAHIMGKVRPKESCVVAGWKLARNGRKLDAGTAVFSQAGEIVGKSRATWIELNVDT